MKTTDDYLLLLAGACIVIALVLWRAMSRQAERRRQKDEDHKGRRRLWSDRR